MVSKSRIDTSLVALKSEGRLWGMIYCLGQWEVVSTRNIHECTLFRKEEVEKIQALLKAKGITAEPVELGELLRIENLQKQRQQYQIRRKKEQYERQQQQQQPA